MTESVKEFMNIEPPEAEIEITVTNLTKSMYLTPILAVGHSEDQGQMFEFGKEASVELQAVAEGGNFDPLANNFNADEHEIIVDPVEGLLGPGQSIKFELMKEHTRFSLISMILPTNDGFVALDNVELSSGETLLYAIDAGTEANDEKITGGATPNVPGIPADPSRLADKFATGITSATAEGRVARHPGISGAEGSALDPERHGWDGAVASVNINKRNLSNTQ